MTVATQKFVISKSVKIIGSVVTAIILALLVIIAVGSIQSLRNAAAVGEQRGGVLGSASEGVAQGVKIDQEQQRESVVISAGRDTFQRTKSEAIRNEPTTADRATRAVPDSVRQAYRDRRRARERLGCAGSECAQDDDAHEAAQR